MSDNIDLQTSHDELAKALVSIVDQIVRGSHMPTPAHLLEVAGVLRDAAPHIREDETGKKPRYASFMAEIIQEKYGIDAQIAPGPR